MAKYRITAPDGAKYEITAPDNASEQDVLKYFQSQLPAQKPAINYGASPDPLNINPFEAPSGQLQRPQGGVTLDPTVAGVPTSQLESVGPTPTLTSRDRMNATTPVRFAREVGNVGLGIVQGGANLVAAGADALGYQAPLAESVRDYATGVITANREDTRRALDMTAAAQEQPFIEAGYTPSPAAQWLARADVAGGAGGVAPWMMAPQGGATAIGRIATNVATGAVGGLVAPQEGQYSAEDAATNAIWGAVLGGTISGGIEGLTAAVGRLRQTAQGRALLASVDPRKIPGLLQALRNSEPPVAGYQPTAAQAAVNVDAPGFTRLQNDISTMPGAADDYLRQSQSANMARADQLARVETARAANAPAAVAAGVVDDVVPPTVPLDDVTANLSLSREQMQLDRDTLTAQVQGVRANQADEVARIEAEAAQRINETKTATAQRLAAEEESAKEAMRRVAADRARKVVEAEAQETAKLSAAEQETQRGLQQLDDAQRELTNAPERFQSEFGDKLSEEAQREYDAVRKVVEKKYQTAFDANKGVTAAVPSTIEVVSRVNNSLQTELSREFSTDTIRALRPFGLADEVSGASAPQAAVTLEQLDEAIKAVNIDMRAAARDVRLRPLQRVLGEIRSALEADLKAAPFSPEGIQLYRDAVDTWKAQVLPRFRTGQINTRLFETTSRNVEPIAPEALVDRFMRNESSAREFVALFRRNDGSLNEDAVTTMREGIFDLFSRQVEKGPEGFDPAAAARWVAGKRDQLRVLEEVSPGIRQELTQYSEAARRVVQTRRELENGLKAIQTQLKEETRNITAKASADARGELARLREQVRTSKAGLRTLVQQQTESINAEAAARLAEAERKAAADASILSVAERKADAALAEHKKLEALLKFRDGADMANKTIENPQVRAEVLHRLSPNGRRALAQRVIWDANNAGTGAERLAHLNAREGAIREVLRAAYPKTVDDLMAGMRQQAEQAVQMEARTASTGGAEAQMTARINAARGQIGPTPLEGANRAAYEAQKAELTANATPEQLSSLEALELDLAREQQLKAHLEGTESLRGNIAAATRAAENTGTLHVSTTSRVINTGMRIWRIFRGEMTRAQATELARTMLSPGATADAIETALARQAQGEALQTAGGYAARAGTIGATQQRTEPSQ